MTTKTLPIGISDFKELIESDSYFIDKTDFIRAVVEEGSKITMLTLKDCKGDTYEKTLEQLSVELKEEYKRHLYLLDDKLNPDDRATFEHILHRTADETRLKMTSCYVPKT